MHTAPNIFSYRQHWAKRFGIAKYLPTSRQEMDDLGWDSCDVILVTGDAYVDHPSFGMALVGRLLEAQGFRVGIISQPDWRSAEPFKALGKPNLFMGVTAGNMDSMVNRYTADRRIRSDDAYSPGGEAGQRPDRSVAVYAQRCREAFKDMPIIIGGIEASLRRIAHYDYWSDKVRHSILPDSKADLLVFGNGERQVVEIAHRLAAGEGIKDITDIRGTSFMRKGVPDGWIEIDSRSVDQPGELIDHPNPYAMAEPASCDSANSKGNADVGDTKVIQLNLKKRLREDRLHSVIRMPSYEDVKREKLLYAHASRVMHLETNPGNARALIQRHGQRDVWLNPPPIPLTSREFDRVYELPYTRQPHPVYKKARIPAYEMIRFSVNIMRGCFGGCTFCSITEHEGRIIQNRSEKSILNEIENIRDLTPEFSGNISDLGGPTANMYRLACKSEKIESACRRLSCVYPGICENLNTDHTPLINLYRKARNLPGIKRVFVASGLRYDLAVESPEYVKELVTHHVGGYLKIAPEHTESGPLSKMMKPGMGTYDRFKEMFEKFSKEAGKEQYLIPYFIAAHPGASDDDMLNLALWLKRNEFRLDQVQNFLPSPMALASTMYHSEQNPLRKLSRNSEKVLTAKGGRQRRLHKAFIRFHDPENWPILREALKNMGRADLIGNGKRHLVPSWQPAGTAGQPKHAVTSRKAGSSKTSQGFGHKKTRPVKQAGRTNRNSSKKRR